MEVNKKKKDSGLVLGGVVLAVVIMTLDFMVPLGVAGGVPYVVLVLLGMWASGKRYIIWAAIAGSVLTILGFYFSPPGGELWKVLFNRFLALFAVWVTAILCLLYKGTEKELRRYRDHLEDLVERRTQDLSASNKELEKYQSSLEDLVENRTKQLEEINKQLIHSEKLSASGRLAACIAHEFNNPICGIRNTLERIEENISLENSHKESVQLAIKECSRVAKLIKQLNDFHRPSSDTVKPVDIHEAINEMTALMKKKLQERNISLEKHYSGHIPEIQIIQDQFKQVILNLLQNAEESSADDGGKIIITTELVNSLIRIHIKDFGQGIPANNLDKLFDPFFTTKSAVKGTGLGLFVSYGIIKNHGGSLTVNSKLGEWSKFTISLPLEKVALCRNNPY